jgi:hypothetical protein
MMHGIPPPIEVIVIQPEFKTFLIPSIPTKPIGFGLDTTLR